MDSVLCEHSSECERGVAGDNLAMGAVRGGGGEKGRD